MHKKLCPDCECVIEYATLSGYMRSVSNNTKCKSCCVKLKNINRDKKIILSVQLCKYCNIEFKRKRSCKFCSDLCRMRNYKHEIIGGDKNINKPSGTFIQGRSGHYNGILFRSSYELRYMIEYLDYHKLEWKSAENIQIKYFFNGKIRIYRPDFIVENRLIEIKPVYMQNENINIAKSEAAKNYCKLNELIYEVVDVGGYSLDTMLDMHKSGLIQLNSYYVNHYKLT